MTNKDEIKLPSAVNLHTGAIERIERLQYEVEHKEEFKPIPILRLEDLTKIMAGGLPIAEPFVVLVLATEKIGKTTLALELADSWTAAGRGCIYYCLEELYRQIIDRMLAKYASISRKSMYARDLTEEDFEKMRTKLTHFKNRNFLLQDQIFKPVNMTRQTKENEFELQIVDNLNLVDKSGIPGRDSREKLEWISGYYRKVRNKDGISTIIVAHEGQAGKAFGSLQANRDADAILLMESVTRKQKELRENGKEKTIEVAQDHLRRITALPSRLPWNGTCIVAFEGDHSRIKNIKTQDFNSPNFEKEVEGMEPVV